MLEYHNKAGRNEHVTFEHENMNTKKTFNSPRFISNVAFEHYPHFV